MSETRRPTRFKELGYHEWGAGNWRFVTEDGAEVGRSYKTKAELLADLDRYARDYGCEGTSPDPFRALAERLAEMDYAALTEYQTAADIIDAARKLCGSLSEQARA